MAPNPLFGQTVWVRVHGRGESERVVLVHVGQAGPVRVDLHARATPGNPRLADEHFPPTPPPVGAPHGGRGMLDQ